MRRPYLIQKRADPFLIPVFNRDFFPSEEHIALSVLEHSVGNLASYADNFKAALDLYEFSEFLSALDFGNKSAKDWVHLAARDGAMTIYHFGYTINELNPGKDLPTLRRLIRGWPQRAAKNLFKSSFPSFEEVRHGVAHHAEKTDSLYNVNKNAYNKGGTPPGLERIFNMGKTSLFLEDALINRRFTMTHDGHVIGYDVTQDTHKLLLGIMWQYYMSFVDVASFSNFNDRASPLEQFGPPSPDQSDHL